MIGVYDARREADEDELVEHAMDRINKKNGQYYLLCYDADGRIKVCLIDMKEGAYEDCESFATIELDAYLNSCITVELTGNLACKVVYDQDKVKYEENLKTAHDDLIKGLRKTQFKLDNSDYKMNFSSNDTCSTSELYLHLKEDEIDQLKGIQGSKAMKEKMRNELIKRWIGDKRRLKFRFNLELEMQDDKEFYKFEQDDSVNVTMQVHFVFVLQHQQVTIKSFARLVENAFQRALAELKADYLDNHSTDRDQLTIAKPQFFNFHPTDYTASTLHVIYPTHLNDDQLVEKRKQLHTALNLPVDRPLIRKLNALRSKPYYNSILSNVHTSLLANAKGALGIVTGTYSYFHYMQHTFDDKGWGCAYRSLQTLISWFEHQGYISIDKIPTHREIQQHLVDIKDKPSSFVNSKRWIGSQEVGYFLNKYGIQFKTMPVNRGSELANKGRELLNHFEKQGTPVMIVGNCLAHTILGVDYNEKTGDLRFLILDPHYTGAEDLKTILKQVSVSYFDTFIRSKFKIKIIKILFLHKYTFE